MGKDQQDKGKAADEIDKEGDEGGDEGGISEATKDFVVKTVNGALNTHLTKAMPRFIDSAITKAVGPLLERFEKFELPKGDDKGEKAEDKGKAGSKDSDELKALRAKLDETNAKFEEEKNARESERASRLRDEERSAAASVLREAGLSEGRVKAALAVLHTEEKRIGRGEDGKIGFKVQKKGYEEFVALDEGLKSWLKTDEGKEFVPARGAGGSGQKGAQPPGQGKNGKPSVSDLRQRLAQQVSGLESE